MILIKFYLIDIVLLHTIYNNELSISAIYANH